MRTTTTNPAADCPAIADMPPAYERTADPADRWSALKGGGIHKGSLHDEAVKLQQHLDCADEIEMLKLHLNRATYQHAQQYTALQKTKELIKMLETEIKIHEQSN